MDEYDAARAITDLLLRKGHRRIGFVRGPKVHLVSMRRYNGYANALGGKGLRIDPTLVVQGDFSRQSGREQAATLFAARPTAIFASNDEMAVGIIDAAQAAGIAIPGDISLAGFDDNAIARTVRPRLTSVRQPLEEMGEAASSWSTASPPVADQPARAGPLPDRRTRRSSNTRPWPVGPRRCRLARRTDRSAATSRGSGAVSGAAQAATVVRSTGSATAIVVPRRRAR